jgi:hypothetical protein
VAMLLLEHGADINGQEPMGLQVVATLLLPCIHVICQGCQGPDSETRRNLRDIKLVLKSSVSKFDDKIAKYSFN